MKLRFAGMEEMQQNIKSQKVEDGTDWTNEHHKIADQADIPALGLFKVSLIHVICGNGELAHIIRRLLRRICVGSIGKNGRKTEAPAILSIFPKFELVPISRYFITLPKALRPSMMPSCRTRRPGSTRMTSAASRATSAAAGT